MQIKSLAYPTYPEPPSLSPYFDTRVNTQSFDVIEDIIRRLDRHTIPFVWLFTKPDPEEDDFPDVDVIGGNGAYSINIRIGSAYYYYVSDHYAGKNVIVWTSDQGLELLDMYICADINTVIAIVKHYNNTGTLYPHAQWEANELL
jgi:hypothetical protein